MSLDTNGPILLAGVGKMGTALLSGWLERGLAPQSVFVQEPSPASATQQLLARHGIKASAHFNSMRSQPGVIVVAVKPQVVDEVFPSLAKLAGPETVVLSIAAGKSIASFERHLHADAGVVRAMPNTPAAIGRGISGAVANLRVRPAQRALCQALLGCVGDVVWLDDESKLDAVTAVSGSGPAYVFFLTEVLAEAGTRAGLDSATAMRLARATVSGAGELLRVSADDAATLRQNVTSPGGTTEAALRVLMRENGGLSELIAEAVLAAEKRSRELGT